MKVNFKRNHPDSVVPTKAYPADGGFDLTAVSVSHQENYIEIDTGISIELPEGHVGLLFPRSSISKKDLDLCNSVGLVDEKFRGNITFRFNLVNARAGVKPDIYKVGDRIGQLVIMPIPKIELVEVSEIDENTERGTGGYGSSDVQTNEGVIEGIDNTVEKFKAGDIPPLSDKALEALERHRLEVPELDPNETIEAIQEGADEAVTETKEVIKRKSKKKAKK